MVSLRTPENASAKMAKSVCVVWNCTNPRRTGKNGSRYCPKHVTQIYEDPRRVRFRNLKKSAKRRGKAFSLVFECFDCLARIHNFWELAGRDSQCLTVDRDDHTQGYHFGNLKFLTQEVNSRKGWYERHGKPWEARAWVPDIEPESSIREGDPF